MKDEKSAQSLLSTDRQHSYQDRINNVSNCYDEMASSTSSTYKEINLDDFRNNTQNIKNRLNRLVESAKITQELVTNKTNMYKYRNHTPIGKILPLTQPANCGESDCIEDQLDDELESVLELTKEDFIQMALHYKSLCNVCI